MIVSTNPTTGDIEREFIAHDRKAMEAALTQAHAAQKKWRKTPVQERCDLLARVAAVLRARQSELAHLITLEMGKPITEAEGEIEKCAWTCDYYAQHAAAMLADQPVPTSASASKVVFEPLGIVLAVMPWNYPFWQVMRFAAPAIAAGNAAVLKHANNVPQCAVAVQSVFDEAGAPPGIFSTLLVEAAEVKGLIEDARIAAVTLTGSTPVGKLVASQAGAVLKKQVLELGGSDPFVVLADADIKLAAKTAVKARFSNAGQSCISSKRFIVEESVADQFVAAFCDEARQLKIGNPMDRTTQIGPMARANLRDELHAQVQRSIAAGATLCMGGEPLPGPGYFYLPTILDHVTQAMAAACEETFGPVAAIMRVASADEAIDVANSLDFGLGAAIWSADVQRAEALARRIDAGAVFINALVASDARVPFGGIKQSGYGRELGAYGLREFTNIKTIWTGPNIN